MHYNPTNEIKSITLSVSLHILQVWVGCVGRSSTKGKIYILDTETRQVLKELHGHNDKVKALCSAEDRYVLSGAGKHDGKIAIWKVE